MAIKTLQGLASEIAKREGKTSETAIGNVREVLAVLSDIIFETKDRLIEAILYANGARRSTLPETQKKRTSMIKKGKKRGGH